MIVLEAHIDIDIGYVGSLVSINCNIPGIDISKPISYILGVQSMGGANPFLIGYSEIGETVFLEETECFIGSEISDVNGDFQNPYIITINCRDNPEITIIFDYENQRYPKTISINGEVSTLSSPIYKFSAKSDEVQITISNWNSANSPLVISGIHNIGESQFTINKNNMLALNTAISSRDSSETASYGIVSSSNQFRFVDWSGNIKSYIDKNLLQDGLFAWVDLIETTTNRRRTVWYGWTVDWSYDVNNNEVSVNLSDRIESLQDIQIPDSQIQYIEETAYTILTRKITTNYSLSKVLIKYSEKALYVLRATNIKYPFLNSASAWAELVKICSICGLHIYAYPLKHGESLSNYSDKKCAIYIDSD